MSFQTIEYGSFLLAVFVTYWWLGRRAQNLLLLAASYVFYGFVDPWLAGLLASFTAVNYAATVGQARRPQRRTAFLVVSVAASLGLLGFFKYFGFFVGEAASALDAIGLPSAGRGLDIVLPIGISFYTFQTLGYAIDIHQGRVGARTNPIDFALFVSFFPQLVSGPIERAARLFPQFENRRRFEPGTVRSGLVLLVWGLFKKLVIADNLGAIADGIFSLESPGMATLWVGVLVFGFQVFADFSGYTDIARGTARLLGFELTNNFDHPFLARSPADYWRRWHITLSSWFRDYVYIPLGGSRAGRARSAVNLMTTFLVAGLWHGAAWNFVLWGAFHGLLVLGYRATRGPAGRLGRRPPGFTAAGVAITFTLTSAGWLLFRESDLGHLWTALVASPNLESRSDLEVAAFLLLQSLIYAAPLWLHAAYAQIAESTTPRLAVNRAVSVAGGAAAGAAMFAGILAMRSLAGGEFIYFRF